MIRLGRLCSTASVLGGRKVLATLEDCEETGQSCGAAGRGPGSWQPGSKCLLSPTFVTLLNTCINTLRNKACRWARLVRTG